MRFNMRSILGRNSGASPTPARPTGGARSAAPATQSAPAPAARPFPENASNFGATFHGEDDTKYSVSDMGGGKFNVRVTNTYAPSTPEERKQYGANGKVERSHNFDTDHVRHDPSTGMLTFKNNSVSGKGQISSVPIRMARADYDNREGALPGGRPAQGSKFPEWAAHLQNDTSSWRK